MIRRLSHEELLRQPARSLGARPNPAPPPVADTTAALAQRLRAFLDEELALAPERIRGLVERELARFHGARAVVVRAHPDDLALLPAPTELSARHELAELLRFEADPEIQRGGCVISAAAGEVDARVETRIARALAPLHGAGA